MPVPGGLHTDTEQRRAEVDVAVAKAFEAARGLHGSPRLVPICGMLVG